MILPESDVTLPDVEKGRLSGQSIEVRQEADVQLLLPSLVLFDRDNRRQTERPNLFLSLVFKPFPLPFTLRSAERGLVKKAIQSVPFSRTASLVVSHRSAAPFNWLGQLFRLFLNSGQTPIHFVARFKGCHGLFHRVRTTGKITLQRNLYTANHRALVPHNRHRDHYRKNILTNKIEIKKCGR